MKLTELEQNMAAALVSIIDSIKIFDSGDYEALKYETMSEIVFRKLKAYNVDLNEILGWDHLKATPFKEKSNELVDTALRINRFIHNECKDVPHDIGMRIVEEFVDITKLKK